MKQRAFDETAEGWDAAAEEYERVFAPFSAQFAPDVLSVFTPSPTDAVLEIAAGTGALTHELAASGAHVVATDISPLMVERLAHGLRECGHERVSAIVADAQALPGPDEFYDAVYCLFGIMFFSDMDAGLLEMARVLKSGGRCVITTWTPRSAILRPLAAILNQMMPGSPPAQALSGPPALGTLEELQRAFSHAGFGTVELHEASHELRLPSPQAYLAQLPRANPNGIMMEQRLPAELYAALREGLIAQLAAEFGDGPIVLQGVANIAAARKP